MISVYNIHHQSSETPKVDEFIPERFEKGKESGLNSGKFYCPFGAGPHKCPGTDIAILIAKSIALAVLSRWDICSRGEEDGGPLRSKLAFGNLVPSDGLPFFLRPRDSRSRESET